MNEIILLFWNSLLSNNIVFVSFIGVLLIIVETPNLKDSYLDGLKIIAGLTLSIIFAWILSSYIPPVYNHFLPGIYFLNSLLGIYMIRSLGLLKGEWIEGLPKAVLALAPLIGIQLLFQGQFNQYSLDFFKIIGSLFGFYLTFIMIAAIKEQLILNETKDLLKSEYILLIVLAFFAAVVVGFNF